MKRYGFRKYKLIENALLDLFHENKVSVRGLEQITFSVSSYNYQNELEVHGFLHVGNDCRSFRSVKDLDRLFDEAIKNEKNKILYQKFEGVV